MSSSPAGQNSPGNGNQQPHRVLQKATSWDSPKAISSAMSGQVGGATSSGGSGGPGSGGETSRGVSLDAIVTEYLMNQHALCKMPMVTCPQFDLFTPHKCPDAKSKSAAPVNFAMRSTRRSLYPPYGGTDGARMDRKLIYSRFRPVRTYRNDTETFTCCAFSPCEQFIMIGNQAGELKLYNVNTTAEEVS